MKGRWQFKMATWWGTFRADPFLILQSLMLLSPLVVFVTGLVYSGNLHIPFYIFNASARFSVTAEGDSDTEAIAILLGFFLLCSSQVLIAGHPPTFWRAWPALVLLTALMWPYVNMSAAGLRVAGLSIIPGSHFSCEVHLQAQGLQEVIPATTENGFAIAWQESTNIFLQHFDKACNTIGGSIQVTPSGSEPSSLKDVKVLSNGSVAVAWLAGGHVWVSLASLQGAGTALRVSGTASSTQSDVQIATSKSDDFAIAWTTLAQDGTSRELALRAFGNTEAGPELAVPGQWRFSPPGPRVEWCGSLVGSLWINSTSNGTQGPFYWSVARDRLWSSAADEGAQPICPWLFGAGPPAQDFRGSSAEASALTCNYGRHRAMWLEKSVIQWKERWGDMKWGHGKFSSALGTSQQTGTALSIAAHGDWVVLVMVDLNGNLKAEFAESIGTFLSIRYRSVRSVDFPVGVQNVTISTGGKSWQPSLTACGTSKTLLGPLKPPAVQCAQREAGSFRSTSSGYGMFLVLAALAPLLCVSAIAPEPSANSTCVPHISWWHFVQQFSLQLRGHPPGLCAICHEEILMRMAFKPCGHTTCLECATKMVKLKKKCHMCRAPVKAAEPVYI